MEHFTCPLPSDSGERILLAHGEGARLSRRMIRELMLSSFDNEYLHPLADGAVLPGIEGRIAMSTDSYVVSPLFFPGGDIGSLSVHGTINDLTACGSDALYLSLGLILEEGLPTATLKRVVASIQAACRAAGVRVVTGDTKVVPRGTADGLYINTTGIGRLRDGIHLGVERIEPGDRILVSGTLGDHGIAVLSAREGLAFEGELRSDSAPLNQLMANVFDAGIDVKFLRDATRGGVSAVLHELAEASRLGAVINERLLPLSDPVRGACELLGLDPLYVANEGKMVLIVSPEEVSHALDRLRSHPLGRNACEIGWIQKDANADVLVRGSLGALRVLDEPSGAPLPRIC